MDRTGVSRLRFREILRRQAWVLKKGLGRSKKVHLRARNKSKIGKGENVFGLRRCERIAVLAELCKSPESPDLNYVKD